MNLDLHVGWIKNIQAVLGFNIHILKSPGQGPLTFAQQTCLLLCLWCTREWSRGLDEKR